MLVELCYLTIFGGVVGFVSHLTILPKTLVGKRYFLYHGLPSLIVSTLFFIDRPLTLAPTTFVVSGIAGCLLSTRTNKMASILLGVSTLAGYICLTRETTGLFSVTLCFSSLVLGHTFGNLCLGHWYLNVPKLPIAILKRQTLVLLALLAIRLIFGTFFFLRTLNDHGMSYFISDTMGLFWLMRYLWGLLLPSALSYFLWETVRLGSTQSATGLYYVLSLMILIGEIVSLYLLTRGIIS